MDGVNGNINIAAPCLLCQSTGSTLVIDPEFGFYGPMGFDLGAILGNFFLSFFSQAGHSNGSAYARWVLDQSITIWDVFSTTFIRIWNDDTAHKGELYPRYIMPQRPLISQDGLGLLLTKALVKT